MPEIRRVQIRDLDFEPQAYREEPGKRGRPALIIQTDTLNQAGHAAAIVIPGTTQIYRDAFGDGFPLRVDQIRTVSVRRLMGGKPLAVLSRSQLKRVEEALRTLMA